MKRILFITLSAISASVGLFAFKTNGTTLTYYWFVDTQLATDPTCGNVITTGDFLSSVFPAALDTTRPGLSCAGSAVYCQFGFTSSQVVFTTNGHGIRAIKAGQVPVTKTCKD